jgi:hypothetical protein
MPDRTWGKGEGFKIRSDPYAKIAKGEDSSALKGLREDWLPEPSIFTQMRLDVASQSTGRAQ